MLVLFECYCFVYRYCPGFNLCLLVVYIGVSWLHFAFSFLAVSGYFLVFPFHYYVSLFSWVFSLFCHIKFKYLHHNGIFFVSSLLSAFLGDTKLAPFSALLLSAICIVCLVFVVCRLTVQTLVGSVPLLYFVPVFMWSAGVCIGLIFLSC